MILDVCCGSEKMYKGRQALIDTGEFVTMDIRSGDFSFKTERAVAPSAVIVAPMILADMRRIPFKSSIFDIVICDPPHMDCGLTGFMGKSYGSWSQQNSIDIIKLANTEFSRVLRYGGTLVFKIMPDMLDRLEKLLTNFKLFLPIHTIRDHGCITSKESRAAAVWYIGIKV